MHMALLKIVTITEFLSVSSQISVWLTTESQNKDMGSVSWKWDSSGISCPEFLQKKYVMNYI